MTAINRMMIGRIEKKEYTPSIEQLQALAEALDFDITTLFVGENKRKCFYSSKKTLIILQANS